jgi:hypothetical protein
MNLTDDRLIRRLLELVEKYELDRRDFVIFGSGPLLAHGLRKGVEDLDVVARGSVWDRVVEYGDPAAGDINGAPLAMFYNGQIQFSRGWVSDEWRADDLIERAELIDELPFAQLGDVLKYKRALRRPKDRADIRALERLLGASAAEPDGVTCGRRAPRR